MKSNYYNPNSISITHRFSILFAAFITFIALAVFFSISHFTLLATTFSASLLYFSCAFMILSLIIELHGKNNADKVTYTGLYVILFVFCIVTFMKYSTPKHNILYEFWGMYSTTPKLLITVIIAYILAIKAGSLTYLKLKNYTKKNHLWLRYIVANFLLLSIFTILINLILFIGTIDFTLLCQLLLSKLLLQYLFIVITLPIVYILVITFKAFNYKAKRGSDEKYNANYAKSPTGSKKYRGTPRGN
ncbi:Putative vitamin uptake transporter [Candidatus Hepatincola sp. Av]